MQNTPLACPLCQYNKIEFYFEDTRSYWQCDNCQLVFVAPSEHLNEADEKEIALHEKERKIHGQHAEFHHVIKTKHYKSMAMINMLDKEINKVNK